MSAFAYLGTYALSTSDDVNYTMEFSIPNNCNYRSGGSAGTYCITIALNPGQSAPSTTFVSQSQNYSASKSGLTVEFEQPDQGGNRRPRLVVTV